MGAKRELFWLVAGIVGVLRTDGLDLGSIERERYKVPDLAVLLRVFWRGVSLEHDTQLHFKHSYVPERPPSLACARSSVS
jgi:hypothetical protein